MNGYNRGLDTTRLIRYRNGYYNVLRWVEYNYYVYMLAKAIDTKIFITIYSFEERK
jgi:hypothetical protein